MSRWMIAGILFFFAADLALAQQVVQPAAYDARPESTPADQAVDVPLDQLGKKFRLIGKLRVPLGDVVKVQGIVVNSRAKGYDSGISVRVYRVNGLATQEFIQIKLNDYYGRDEIPNLEVGKAFEFEGFETGGFVGIPPAAYKRAGAILATTDQYFLHELTVYEQTEIKLQPFSPADFVGREALIQGQATNEGGSAYIAAGNWRLLVDNGTPWPRATEGKVVEARGTIRTLGNKTGTYRLDKGGKGASARLVQLADQLGKQVILRGTLSTKTAAPSFFYRGSEVHLENAAKLASQLAAGSTTVEVTGLLEQGPVKVASLDSLNGEQIIHRGYILRKATLKPADALLAIERAEPLE
ncbi:hypothetical protein ETAA8_10980 [Anatilimnocola aggregata]|uniref:Uncharacterized protein n=1 Tax=Anatilimnocola aggregata TaxID=2528021 RepID=A0A517Y734_9BACT|nr:hypothetical protein [Anatilimnocola aggregata]QDU26026.1 hypothetical protein ETAA8_10980 [Anatilimnocola aggregata]